MLVTAKANIRDIVNGFEAGGDDYIIKPFEQAALVARVCMSTTPCKTRCGGGEEGVVVSQVHAGCGTCRMSENPRDGVCNKFGQAHDVRNLFISDGSHSPLAAPKIQL